MNGKKLKPLADSLVSTNNHEEYKNKQEMDVEFIPGVKMDTIKA